VVIHHVLIQATLRGAADGSAELAQLWMQDCPDLLLLFGSMAALRRRPAVCPGRPIEIPLGTLQFSFAMCPESVNQVRDALEVEPHSRRVPEKSARIPSAIHARPRSCGRRGRRKCRRVSRVGRGYAASCGDRANHAADQTWHPEDCLGARGVPGRRPLPSQRWSSSLRSRTPAWMKQRAAVHAAEEDQGRLERCLITSKGVWLRW
jgi:hypothetical protein